MRAAELDTSIAPEVEREMGKIEAMQKVEDENDKGFAKNVVQDTLEAGHPSSERPPTVEAPVPTTNDHVTTQQLEALIHVFNEPAPSLGPRQSKKRRKQK